MSTGRAVAVILARAGSKGVPGKNRARLAGKPCVQYTIEQAQAARCVGLVAVSTDDPVVARIARRAACVVIDRPANLAHDRARVDDAARHAFSTLAERGLIDDQAPVVILYANVPIRPPGVIDRALRLLSRTGCDSVQTYQGVGKHHPWWTARVAPDGRVRPWAGRVLNHGVFRRQDLPPAFIPDGSLIALTAAALFLRCGARARLPGKGRGPHDFFGLDRRGLVNPEGRVVDIDSPVDLLVASAILRAQQRAHSRTSRVERA
ncbi:MAG: acylneuraminate cytidylyltransferase family protein [Phycisphaerales bacterium]